MNKRPAQWQGGDERYGAFGGQAQQEDMSDVPKQATAAQLAKRKIAQLKRRPRSESPLTSTASIFEQANQNGFMAGNNAQPASNPFGTSSSFNFGGNQQTTNGASTPSFGSGGAGGAGFNFGVNNTQNSNQTGSGGFTFGSGSTTPATSFAFGQQQPQNSQSAQTNGTTPSASFSFGQQPAQQNGGTSTSFNFGQNDATPKPATTNIFGNAFSAGQSSGAQQQNPFGAAQVSSKPSTPFGNSSAEQSKSTGGFNFGNSANEQPAQKSTGGFTFGTNTGQQSEKDSQVQSTLFSGFGQQKSSEPQTSTAATNGWTAFTQTKPADTSASATNGINGTSGSSTPLFAASTQPAVANASSGSSIFSGLNEQSAKTPTFKFSPVNSTPAVDNDYSMMSPENTPQKPSAGVSSAALTNGFGASKQTTDTESTSAAAAASASKPAFDFGKGASLFDRISKDDASATPLKAAVSASTPSETSFKPSTSLFASAQPSTSSSRGAPPKAVSPTQSASTPATSDSVPRKDTSMSSTKAEHYADIRELNESLLQHLQSQDASKDWTTIFTYYQSEIANIQQRSPSTADSQAPASKTSFSFGNSVLGKPTATPLQSTSSASPARQASIPGTLQHSANEQTRSSERPLYPQLPSNASNTAKLFQATLDKSTASQPSSTSLFSSGVDDSKTGTASSTGGFRPTGVSSAGTSFLSSFGQKATETANKEKKKRKDEDFDSDEDNEADWEKKDAEEQEARRARLEEASKNAKGFVFTPSGTSGGTSAFSGFAQAVKPATQQPSASLFNFNPTGSSTSTSAPAATPKPGLFGAPSTPATASNGPSSIFSNASSSSTPAPLFSFQKPASTPAAPSPQAAQDGAATEGDEDDAAPPEPQAQDMAILLPSELSENEVLFHVEKSKSRKFEPKASEGGSEKLTWVDKGLGPLWILRNKTTGKSRVLQKIKDSGRAAMNFSVLAGDESMYKHEGMNGKAVTATFVDHINSNGGKPTRWIIMVGKPDDAKAIARILHEEQKKASRGQRD